MPEVSELTELSVNEPEPDLRYTRVMRLRHAFDINCTLDEYGLAMSFVRTIFKLLIEQDSVTIAQLQSYWREINSDMVDHPRIVEMHERELQVAWDTVSKFLQSQPH